MMFRAFSDASDDFLWAWGIVPPDFGKSREEQTTELLEEMERTLESHGMSFCGLATLVAHEGASRWICDDSAGRGLPSRMAF